MVAFKQGQQVRCIDVGGDYYLRRGEVYEVVCHRGNSVRLSSVPGNWHESRFELVNSAVDPVSPVSAEAEDDKLATEFTSLHDTKVELPEPSFGIGRYLSAAGTRDSYTKKQLIDYGDKRAALEIERLNKQCRDLDAKIFKTVAECQTLVDAAQAERDATIKAQRGVLEQALTTLVSLSDLDDYTRDTLYFAAYDGAETIAAIKEILK